MLSEDDIEKALQLIQGRLDALNTFYIKRIAAQIQRIGEMNQSSINRMIVLAEVEQDAIAVTAELQKVMGATISDMQKIYAAAAKETYTDPRFRDYFTESKGLPTESKARLNQLVASMAMQTAMNMVNFSNTTAVSQAYRDAADRGIMAVTSGLTDYKAATREAIRTLGTNGMQVVYESGYHRRLDTAIRQNIIDGTNQISQQGANIVG